jgi:hypothetical protein
MEFEGRTADFSDRIRRAMDFLNCAASRWWQAAPHAWLRESCIPPNKARIWSLEQAFSGQALLCLMVLQFVVELPWRETAAVKTSGNSFNKVFYLVFCCRRFSLNLPPPTRSGSLRFDGGFALKVRWLEACCCWIMNRSEAMLFSASLHGGVGEGSRADKLWFGIRQRWSRDTDDCATSSAAKVCRPTQLALWWPSSSPVMVTGVCSTSRWRPYAEWEAAFPIFSEPSGDVPGTGEDGRALYSLCVSGDRGPDGFLQYFRRVFSVKSRDRFVCSYLCKVLTAFVPVPLI